MGSSASRGNGRRTPQRNAGADGGGLRSSLQWDVIRSTPRYAYLVAVVAAVGGMLFGYDIGVISGAEKLITKQWNLSSGSEELAVSAVLIGAILGGVVAGRLADRFSRRFSLVGLAAVYSAGAIATALAPGLVLFDVFRIIVGFAVGASSMIVPAYIAEMAPPQIRGGLVILQQLAISGGIFISYVADYVFFKLGWGWRPMFAAAVLPGVVLGVGMFFMAYSPRWLAMQNRWREAQKVVQRINPDGEEDEMRQLHEDLEETQGATLKDMLKPGVRGALLAGVGLAVLQQFVGPNTVLFYGPTIFGYVGISAGSDGLVPEMLVGAVLFIFVLPTIAFVDVIGRKRLFYIGLVGMGSMLVLLGLAFATGVKSWGIGVLFILLIYIGAYSLSISPLFWLMTAELFPNRLRGVGASASTVANWSANLLISLTFLTAVNALGKDVVFWIYAAFAGIGLVFVYRCIPETKGHTLEEVEVYWTHDRQWPQADESPETASVAAGGG